MDILSLDNCGCFGVTLCKVFPLFLSSASFRTLKTNFQPTFFLPFPFSLMLLPTIPFLYESVEGKSLCDAFIKVKLVSADGGDGAL